MHNKNMCHFTSTMTPLLLVLTLIVQCSLIQAEDVDVPENKDELLQSFKSPADDEVVKDFHTAKRDWMDMFLMPNPNNLFPSSAVAMMSQAVNCNKTAEEQIKEMKEMAQQISSLIQNELANLLQYTIGDNKTNENSRKRRSVETPLDSTQLVMRLLKHIKSNNEYQNIAIEKMMSAQEIADKFGIEFNPDPEILSDLAIAANEQAQEITTMLQDACDLKNITTDKVEFVPVTEASNLAYDSYYAYEVHPEEKIKDEDIPSFEYEPSIILEPETPVNHVHGHTHETQIPAPPTHHHHCPHVTPRPNIFDPFPFTPVDHSSYFSVEPVATFFVPIDDPEPEPEIVGEEIEETISTKLFVERGDEPGSSTINHVTTYTVAEKSHYRAPHIDKYPQQFERCFFLV